MLEHDFELFAKIALAVMVFLVFDVAANIPEAGGTDGEGGVSFLPGEGGQRNFVVGTHMEEAFFSSLIKSDSV